MGACSQHPCSELSSLGPSWQMIRFEKETRYYTLQLEEDLLGDWVVVTIHGRINSKLGQNKLVAFKNFNDAFSHFQKLCHIRHQRKYLITSWKRNHIESTFPNRPTILPFCTKPKKHKKNQKEKNIYNNYSQNSFINKLLGSI